jgi:hypothetical protein
MDTKAEMKYQLCDAKSIGGVNVYRIRALKSFSDVKAGDLGGFVAGFHNLSHSDNAWIYDEAIAFGDYCVSGDETIRGSRVVFGDRMRDFY